MDLLSTDSGAENWQDAHRLPVARSLNHPPPIVDLLHTVHLHTATVLLQKHELWLTTSGDPSWHDFCRNDAMDHWPQYEGQFHLLLDRH